MTQCPIDVVIRAQAGVSSQNRLSALLTRQVQEGLGRMDRIFERF